MTMDSAIQVDPCRCSKEVGSTLDISTPLNVILTPYYKRSYGHYSMKERIPVILTNIVDSLVRSKKDIANTYGQEAVVELKSIIGEISKFKHEIQTNKDIPKLISSQEDVAVYNEFIKKELDLYNFCTYFSTHWLFVECYVYRKIAGFFKESVHLQDFDYFARQKDALFHSSLPLIRSLAINIIEVTREKVAPFNVNVPSKKALKAEFANLLKLNLWSNKCDLCLPEGLNQKDFRTIANDFDENILCNQTDEVFEAIYAKSKSGIIDFVCDNTGYEIFTDLCLADFLITNNLAKKIRFHIKSYPWFISDVTKRDIPWILQKLISNEDNYLHRLGGRWSGFFNESIWNVEESHFWTTYLPFNQMLEHDEALFRMLAQCKLIFFKGDLNYRKLLGDRNWDPVTPFANALQGFHPAQLCALRTLKADLICGLKPGLATKMEETDKDWLISGNYGVIQFCGNVTQLPD